MSTRRSITISNERIPSITSYYTQQYIDLGTNDSLGNPPATTFYTYLQDPTTYTCLQVMVLGSTNSWYYVETASCSPVPP